MAIPVRARDDSPLETLKQLNILDAPTRAAILARHTPELRNHNGRRVGDIRPYFTLQTPALVV